MPEKKAKNRVGHEAPHGASRSGFTLIEISMVLILFSSAIGGLLSFFPVGLRLENNALSDTAQTMFALDVLGNIEAKAAKIHDWETWNDDKRFIAEVLPKNSYVVGYKNKRLKIDMEDVRQSFGSGTSGGNAKLWRTDEEGTLIEQLNTQRDSVRYVIQLSPVETPIYFGNPVGSQSPKNRATNKVRRVIVWATDRRDADPFLNTPFVLDLVFQPDVDDIFSGTEI